MQTRRIVASLPNHDAYDIRVGAGTLERLGQDVRSCARLAHVTQVAIVTDANVGPLYAKRTAEVLRQAGYRAHILTIPAGETSKKIEVANELWQALAQLGCTRDTVVVSLGGGVVGDIAGFIAATYMRGVPLVHVPTTVLAMIDASVGGKTALDLPQGKNLVGAFKQPEYVCADLTTLSTLPPEHWKSGLGELAKMAVITSDEFFFWLTDHAADLADGQRALAEHPDVLAEAITRAISAKLDCVAADEFDTKGIRAKLNYGHTLGHALEACSGYAAAHGLAVAEGMRFAARLAAAVCGTSLDVVTAQDGLLDVLAIPPLSVAPDADELLAFMHADKKASAGTVRFVLPTDIAQCSLYEVDDETLAAHLAAWAAQRKPKRRTSRKRNQPAQEPAGEEPKKTSSRSRKKTAAQSQESAGTSAQEPADPKPQAPRKRRTKSQEPADPQQQTTKRRRTPSQEPADSQPQATKKRRTQRKAD